MLIFYDNSPNQPNLIWDDANETFTCIRANSSKTDSNTNILEVTVTNYEHIQYMEGHLNKDSAVGYIEQIKGTLSDEKQIALLDSTLKGALKQLNSYTAVELKMPGN